MPPAPGSQRSRVGCSRMARFGSQLSPPSSDRKSTPGSAPRYSVSGSSGRPARCATWRSPSAPMPRAGRPSWTAATSDHGRSSAGRSDRRRHGWPPRTAHRHAGRPSRGRSPSRRAADPRSPTGGGRDRPTDRRALSACRRVRALRLLNLPSSWGAFEDWVTSGYSSQPVGGIVSRAGAAVAAAYFLACRRPRAGVLRRRRRRSRLSSGVMGRLIGLDVRPDFCPWRTPRSRSSAAPAASSSRATRPPSSTAPATRRRSAAASTRSSARSRSRTPTSIARSSRSVSRSCRGASPW